MLLGNIVCVPLFMGYQLEKKLTCSPDKNGKITVKGGGNNSPNRHWKWRNFFFEYQMDNIGTHRGDYLRYCTVLRQEDETVPAKDSTTENSVV